jgi:hypothetical protein
MAKFSQKLMGKEVGAAAVYAKPHTMTSKNVTVEANPGKGENMGLLNNARATLGNITSQEQPDTKTSGIKMRGTGAATKGLVSRGPMA